MPVDQKTRPYDPAQDPGNPLAAGPSWAKIGAAALGTFAAVLVAIQDGNIFPADSVWAKLIGVGIKASAAIVPVLLLIYGENQKELASTKGAAAIGEVKEQGKADLAVAQVTGQAPAKAVVVAVGQDQTTTETKTTTGPPS